MKLRITQTAALFLTESGCVEEQVEFRNAGMTYTVIVSDSGNDIRASFVSSAMGVTHSRERTARWASSAEAGIKSLRDIQPNPDTAP